MNRDKGGTEKMDCRPVFVKNLGCLGMVDSRFTIPMVPYPIKGLPSPWGTPEKSGEDGHGWDFAGLPLPGQGHPMKVATRDSHRQPIETSKNGKIGRITNRQQRTETEDNMIYLIMAWGFSLVGMAMLWVWDDHQQARRDSLQQARRSSAAGRSDFCSRKNSKILKDQLFSQ